MNMRLMIATIAMVLMIGCGYGISSGTGKKIGQVVKIGEYGAVCTTYEGELMRGGFSGGTGVNGQAFHFSVKDKKLADELTKIMEDQQEIEVTYVKSVFSGPCSGDAGVWVTGYRILSAPQRPADAKEAIKQELLQKLKELEAK